jgi:DNA polymerase-3 subunit alpha
MKHPITGFEHLHRHSDFSLLDGYATVEEYAELSKEANQKYLCISDHGMMGVIPRQTAACDKYNLSPIYACELYVNPIQTEAAEWDHVKKEFAPEDQWKIRKSYHLLAIAYNDIGYKNLVRLTSWAWIEGMYYKPRVNHEQLMAHKEGIIFTSCCYIGEIGQTFDRYGEEAAFEMVEKYMAMFGGNFYLELMLLDFEKQKPFDAFLIKAHEKYNIPLILTQDCHYARKEESHNQRLMLMINQGNTIAQVEAKIARGDAGELFELQDQNLWMKTEAELNEKWESDYIEIIDEELFKQAKANTVKICEMINVELDRSIKLPQIPDADEKFKEEIMKGFLERGVPKTRAYLDRVKEEFSLISRKGFSSYFLIQKQMTDEARRVCPELLGWGDGSQAVGTGRGSVCSSLAAYCLRLHDIDPIKHDLLFSRFLSEARGGKSIKFKFKGEPIRKAS